ncbi:response regulator [Ramlibacter humi]|uniref:histidine kinase n=1 Tax=Ramlibacter humi TaxID=2530451 RepID=A0A4Z0BE54_9BURK|nr:response regulator [Ramlibacter humi]TFY96178.1 response regulator [Ramlibacter humi]
MLEPPFPPDEAARLAELHRLHVLDTLAEERFDRITRTAQRMFGVPIALISLIDANRQWFKSRQGITDSQTPRRESFCAHAILQDGPLVITDATADPRFADNPNVTGPLQVRAYAGQQLHGRGGARLGTLCLIDSKRREFSADDLAALRDLAAWAELELNIYSIEQATLVAREKEEKLQAILDNAGDGIVTLSAEGAIETFNVAAWAMFGGSVEVIGQSVFDWVAPESRDAVLAAFTGGDIAPGSEGSVRREVACLRADGSTFPAEIVVTRLRNPKPGWTLIVRDASERKRVEKMKNEFISTVSHELRTPLTSVRGSLGLVLGGAVGEVPAQARSLLDIAAKNCDRLVRLINDMLDIEKIESGHMRLEMAPQQLLPLAKQAIATTESFAQQFRVQLRLQAEAVDARVMGDADRLTQVLVNLLSNAAKFSPEGGGVDVGLAWADASQSRVRMTVADRGAGIPPELADKLFGRFVQGDASDARAKPGTGLGLAISKAIVERLGGRIGFEPREGGGTAFFVDLPALPRPGAPAARQASVLVCEDDPDIARLVTMLLERGGLHAEVAGSAAEARKKLASQAWRAMTLDIGLPGEDGLSLLRWVRSQPATADLPVVVLSASDRPDGASAAAFGAMDWLAKPIDEDRLLSAIRQAMRGAKRERPALLHVEDDPDLRRVVAAMVGPGCDTVAASTLDEARRQLALRAFDLILLDLQLPDGNASELLASLPPPNTATPVVIFSGTETGAPLAAQVRSALVKSRTPADELLALLNRLIGRREQHNPAP